MMMINELCWFADTLRTVSSHKVNVIVFAVGYTNLVRAWSGYDRLREVKFSEIPCSSSWMMMMRIQKKLYYFSQTIFSYFTDVRGLNYKYTHRGNNYWTKGDFQYKSYLKKGRFLAKNVLFWPKKSNQNTTKKQSCLCDFIKKKA